MKAYGGVAVYIHIFLTSVLAGCEWSASRPCCFTPRESGPCTHWRRSLVGPRAGLNEMEKRKFLTLPGLKTRPLGRPSRSQLLYRLCYPASKETEIFKIFCLSIGHCKNILRIRFSVPLSLKSRSYLWFYFDVRRIWKFNKNKFKFHIHKRMCMCGRFKDSQKVLASEQNTS
jgi:hypothetical protein